MKKLRYGIIGTGGMAKWHAEQATLAKLSLTSCLDVDTERAQTFAQTHGFKQSTTSLNDLLDQVDVVSIVTPDRFHAELAIKVLKADKHLLCEKPLATNLADARRVARAAVAAEKRGIKHLINFSYRRSAAFYEAAKLVQSGALGEIRHVQGRYLQSWLASTMWGDWSQGNKWMWRLQTSEGSGGVLGDLGCHLLDFITGVAGDLNAVRCTMRTFPKIERKTGKKYTKWKGVPLDANDSVIIDLDFTNGALGMADTSRWTTGHANHVILEVHGTDGALAIDLDKGYERIDTCLGKDINTRAWKTRTLRPTPTAFERLIRAIKTGKSDQPDLVRGAQVQSYLDACERSAKDGKWAKIKAWI